MLSRQDTRQRRRPHLRSRNVDASEGPTSEELRRRVDEACRAAAASSAAMRRVAARLRQIRCEECGRAWSDPRERWRAFVLDEDDTPQLLAFCPGCAELEFGE